MPQLVSGGKDHPVGTAYWVSAVQAVRRDVSTGRRAPYKPLLLLWMIGRISAGLPTRVAFKESEEPLRELMDDFRLGVRAEPGLPFVHLGAEPELWRVEDATGANLYELTDKNKRRRVTYLRENAIGVLAADFAKALTRQEVLVAVVNAVLQMEFPETAHEAILAAVGLSGRVQLTPKAKDPQFAATVLLAYEFSCAFCGFDGRIKGSPVGIDAAHVRMRAHQGPDQISNGVALCALHHRLFDRGVLGLSEDLRILVSQYFLQSDGGVAYNTKDLLGEPMRRPQGGYEPPALPHVKWHFQNLFMEPSRLPGS